MIHENAIDMIRDLLETQRHEIFFDIDNFKRKDTFQNKQELDEWLTSSVFEEDDRLEQFTQGLCDIESIIGLNEFRDYQQDTIKLALERWTEEAKP